MKKYSSETTMPNLTASSSLRNLTATKPKEMSEFRNYISKNENEFYSSAKVFFKPTTSYNKYSFSTPDYFRVSARNEGKTVSIYLLSQAILNNRNVMPYYKLLTIWFKISICSLTGLYSSEARSD